MPKRLYNCFLEKAPEQVFINSLRREFEWSATESLGVLELARSCLFGELPQTFDKLLFLYTPCKVKHGKHMSEQDVVRVELSLDGGIEKPDVLPTQGGRPLQQ